MIPRYTGYLCRVALHIAFVTLKTSIIYTMCQRCHDILVHAIDRFKN